MLLPRAAVCNTATLLALLGLSPGFCIACAPTTARAAPNDDIRHKVKAASTEAFEAYQWFHQHPELSDREVRTAEHLAAELEKIGLEVHRGIGGHGVVGVLRGKAPGQRNVVLYRADMDALPVVEQTGLGYASQNPGVMHACGHDLHMAIAVGALRVLAERRSSWAGTVLFVGQPAEEIGAGAKRMLDDPSFAQVLEASGAPVAAFALHDAADMEAGHVGLVAGWHSANVDSVDIIVHGKAGHGARPNETIDPVVIGSEIVLALQTIVSRRLPPGERAVVTVGRFEAGTKRNVIPSKATLNLTVRSYGDAMRSRLLDEIRLVASGIAKAHRAPAEPTIVVQDENTPAGYNDPRWSTLLATRFERVFGADRIAEVTPTTTGEDFARYGKRLQIPSVMWRVGATPKDRFGDPSAPGLHSDRFAPDVTVALPTGIESVVEALLIALQENGG